MKEPTPPALNGGSGQYRMYMSFHDIRAASAALLLSIACESSTEPSTQDGAVEVSVATASAAIDADGDGYTVTIDDGLSRNIGINSSVTFSDLAAGNHVIRLAGLSTNCSVDGENPRSVSVVAGTLQAIPLAFTVSCVPKIGTVQIIVETLGSDQDSDGYSVAIGGLRLELPRNGTVTIENLRDGKLDVALSGVSGNCSPDLYSPFVQVSFGTTARIDFRIRCVTLSQIAFVRGIGPDAEIYAISSDGTGARNLTNRAGADFYPSWSPSGDRIAFEGDTPGSYFDVYVMNADGSNLTRITSGNGIYNGHPVWSPDGRRLAFESWRDGNLEIYLMNPDGTDRVRLTHDGGFDSDPTWSPDGKRIAFRSNRNGHDDIYVMNADGSNTVHVTDDDALDLAPVWSPDGLSIAFNRPEGAGTATYLIRPDGSGLHRLNGVSGVGPEWSPDGTSIVSAVWGNCPFAYYGPSCSHLEIVSIEGIRMSSFNVDDAYQPAWQP